MKKTAVLFPGQGSQYPGMGRDLYDGFDSVKKIFEEAGDTLGFDLKEMCFHGSPDELVKTENTQPALLTVCFSAFRVLMDETGAAPDYLAGHSLGEITALACSGALAFKDAVKIVRQRGIFMMEAARQNPGAMAAISGAPEEAVREACITAGKKEADIWISCINSQEQLVIAGGRVGVMLACETLEKLPRVKTTLLKVSAPFHTPYMEPAALRLKGVLDSCNFGGFKWPVISNVTALPYYGPEEIIRNLTLQMTMPVMWRAVMDFLAENSRGIAVEVGPLKVLKNLSEKNRTGLTVYSFEKSADIPDLRLKIGSEAGMKNETGKNSEIIARCLAAAVCAGNKNWDEAQYKAGVIEPCEKIRDLLKNESEDRGRIGPDVSVEAVKLLKIVLETKKVDRQEMTGILSEIWE